MRILKISKVNALLVGLMMMDEIQNHSGLAGCTS